MKIFGCKKDDDESTPSFELSDVSIAANPDELRKIAKFFEQAAADIEKYGKGFEHEHLQDNQEGFDGNPDIQVYNAALL